MSKKEEVITKLFEDCRANNNWIFDNDKVKEVCVEVGFGNPFDVTKIDNQHKLPKILKENDYALIHLGDGKHQFIKGNAKLYHVFENVEKTIEWEYKKSLLNEYNSSESNILSVANNQRILHHFLFELDTEFTNLPIEERPKTYFPHRTKTSFNYFIGPDVNLILDKIQIEIDLTIEYKGIIGVFEAKNGKPDSFAVYQLYHPFLYYYNAGLTNKAILCVYVVKTIEKGITCLRLWAYTFEKPEDMASIKLKKSACYKLIHLKKL